MRKKASEQPGDRDAKPRFALSEAPSEAGVPVGRCLRREVIAKRLDQSKRTLERMAKDGSGPPFFMLGRIPLYPEAAFNDWLQTKLAERK